MTYYCDLKTDAGEWETVPELQIKVTLPWEALLTTSSRIALFELVKGAWHGESFN